MADYSSLSLKQRIAIRMRESAAGRRSPLPSALLILLLSLILFLADHT